MILSFSVDDPLALGHPVASPEDPGRDEEAWLLARKLLIGLAVQFGGRRGLILVEGPPSNGEEMFEERARYGGRGRPLDLP